MNTEIINAAFKIVAWGMATLVFSAFNYSANKSLGKDTDKNLPLSFILICLLPWVGMISCFVMVVWSIKNLLLVIYK